MLQETAEKKVQREKERADKDAERAAKDKAREAEKQKDSEQEKMAAFDKIAEKKAADADVPPAPSDQAVENNAGTKDDKADVDAKPEAMEAAGKGADKEAAKDEEKPAEAASDAKDTEMADVKVCCGRLLLKLKLCHPMQYVPNVIDRATCRPHFCRAASDANVSSMTQ